MIVDGIELLRMIRDYEIKDKSKIIAYYKTNKHHEFHYECNMLLTKENKEVIDEFNATFFIDKDYKFEILSEEDEEIDIDSIEEVKHIYIYNLPPNVESVDDRVTINEEKINELIKAVKQLYRMTKEDK